MANYSSIVQQLESCAQILMAPPNLTTPQQLQDAQNVFMEFQKTKQPFDLCRHLLENSQTAYVKFQAASCLKNGVIRDWKYLKENKSNMQLLTYLFEYVVNRENLEPFVREQLLLVCAIVLKRMNSDDNTDVREITRNQFRQQTQSGDGGDVNSVVASTIQSLLSMIRSKEDSSHQAMHKKFAATSFLYAILNEYSSSTRASDFGLPWIKHLAAKKLFETSHLKNMFNSTLEAVNQMLTGPDSQRLISKEPEPTTLLLKLLQVLETIFTWNFDIITILSSQYAKHVDSIETPIFQPNMEWRDTLINESTISFIFFLYNSVRQLGQEALIHHSLQCLSQLSSLTGSVLANSKFRLTFVEHLMNGALVVMNNDLAALEVTPVSSMLYRICLHLQNRDTIQHVQKSLTHKFCEMLSQLTCKLLMNGLKAEYAKLVDDESDRFKQAIDNVCDAWMVLLQAVEKYDRQESPTELVSNHVSSNQSASIREDLIDETLLSNCTRQVFECFLRCHISTPEGLRDATVNDDDDEIQEYEEEDSVQYADQLNSIGTLGRVDLKYAVRILSHMLQLRINTLNNCLHLMSTSGRDAVAAKDWAAVNDDIHWLVMITTWTLTQNNYGERDLIPSEVMKLSITSNPDIGKSMEALKVIEPGTEDANIDPVVRLIVILLKLCKIEQYVMENNLQLFSPQVSSTLSSFVARFMSGYLLPNEPDYNEMSMTIVSCFGKDSQVVSEVINFVVGHSLAKIFAWSSESELKESSSQSLVSFASNSPDRCRVLINSPLVVKLVTSHADSALSQGHVSVQTRKNIYHLFVLLASQRHDLWEQICNPLKQRYTKLQAAAGARDLSESVRMDLIDFCDTMIGMTAGVTPANLSHVWSQFLGVIYQQDAARLMDVFHNYSEAVVAILEVTSAVTSRVLCFLEPTETVQFYEATINVLTVYSKNHNGRSTVEATSEEESCRDIELIMQVLNDLAAKDFIDWFPSVNENNDQPATVSAIQVVFLGLNIVMPLMSAQLLENTKLSTLYYKVITFLCEDLDRLKEVPKDLLRNLMATVQHALKSSFGSDIKCNCLTMLFMLAGHRIREPENFKFIDEILEPFLSVIFEFTLIECGTCKDVTLREHVANTMFMLICCYPETYNNLVQRLIQVNVEQRATGGSAEAAAQLDRDLRHSFSQLMEDIPLNPAQLRQKRTTFKQRFEVFVNELQGLLRIK